MRGADFLHTAQGALNGLGQFLQWAFAGDVHEINFRIVVKEMIVQRGHIEAIGEGHAHDRVDLVLKAPEDGRTPLNTYVFIKTRRTSTRAFPFCKGNGWCSFQKPRPGAYGRDSVPIRRVRWPDRDA